VTLCLMTTASPRVRLLANYRSGHDEALYIRFHFLCLFTYHADGYDPNYCATGLSCSTDTQRAPRDRMWNELTYRETLDPALRWPGPVFFFEQFMRMPRNTILFSTEYIHRFSWPMRKPHQTTVLARLRRFLYKCSTNIGNLETSWRKCLY